MGMIRTPVRRGGGVAFAKVAGARAKSISRRMRTLAWKNAILAKLESDAAVIVDGLSMGAPKTKDLATTLGKVGASVGCVLVTDGVDRNVYLSGRNIPEVDVRPMMQLNAYEILRRRKLVFTRPAFDALVQRVSGSDN